MRSSSQACARDQDAAYLAEPGDPPHRQADVLGTGQPGIELHIRHLPGGQFTDPVLSTDLPDLSGYQAYACGAPVMVDAAQRDLVQRCGLPAMEFFADSFTTAADTVAASA